MIEFEEAIDIELSNNCACLSSLPLPASLPFPFPLFCYPFLALPVPVSLSLSFLHSTVPVPLYYPSPFLFLPVSESFSFPLSPYICVTLLLFSRILYFPLFSLSLSLFHSLLISISDPLPFLPCVSKSLHRLLNLSFKMSYK